MKLTYLEIVPLILTIAAFLFLVIRAKVHAICDKKNEVYNRLERGDWILINIKNKTHRGKIISRGPGEELKVRSANDDLIHFISCVDFICRF